MNYSFASISADHLGYNLTIFDAERRGELVRILSSDNCSTLSYQDIVDAVPPSLEMATVAAPLELRGRLAESKHIRVIKPPTVDPATSLCTMADKLNSGKMMVASKHEKEILSALRSSKPDEIPHNIRSLINICDNWGIWTNLDRYRSPNVVVWR